MAEAARELIQRGGAHQIAVLLHLLGAGEATLSDVQRWLAGGRYRARRNWTLSVLNELKEVGLVEERVVQVSKVKVRLYKLAERALETYRGGGECPPVLSPAREQARFLPHEQPVLLYFEPRGGAVDDEPRFGFNTLLNIPKSVVERHLKADGGGGSALTASNRALNVAELARDRQLFARDVVAKEPDGRGALALHHALASEVEVALHEAALVELALPNAARRGEAVPGGLQLRARPFRPRAREFCVASSVCCYYYQKSLF